MRASSRSISRVVLIGGQVKLGISRCSAILPRHKKEIISAIVIIVYFSNVIKIINRLESVFIICPGNARKNFVFRGSQEQSQIV
jgi:hypothetical protein